MKNRFESKIMLLCILVFSVLYINLGFADIDDYVEYDPNRNLYYVTPSGVDDTENIQYALNQAVTTGPKSTVQLSEGEFILSKPVLVADFDGVFKGSGKTTTVIREKSGIEFPLAEEPLGAWPNMVVFYLKDRGGSTCDRMEISISDMSFVCNEIPKTWRITFPGLVGVFELPFSDYNPLVVFGKLKGIETRVIDGEEYQVYAGEPSYYDVTIMNILVDATTSYDHAWGWWSHLSNVHNGIAVQGWVETYPVNDDTFIFYGVVPNSGKIEVSGCTIQECQYGMCITDQYRSEITIEDNYLIDGGVDADCFTGIECITFTDSKTWVRGNEVYNYDTGIHVYGGVDYGHAYNNKISAKVTGINLDLANYWTLKFNKFVDMSEVLVSAINCSGKYNKIQWNDYSESGIPGLSETTPYGPVCVYLDDDSWGNAVYEKYLPSNTQIADQVTDLGLDNKIFSPLK